jgi:hypothetical protein
MTTKNLSTAIIPSSTYWYEIRANGRPKSFKDRVGDLLRNLAQKLDGRHSLSIDIDTLPVISEQAKAECILAGIKNIKENVDGAVRDEMIENQIKRHIPTVCGADKRDTLRQA